MDSPSTITCPNTTATDITGYAISATSGENIITANTATGTFTLALAGVYYVSVVATWDANTTGSRIIGINGSGFTYALDDDQPSQLATNIAYGGAVMRASAVIVVSAGATVKAYGLHNSGANRTIGNASLKIVRL
jgi:hypothetical protein